MHFFPQHLLQLPSQIPTTHQTLTPFHLDFNIFLSESIFIFTESAKSVIKTITKTPAVFTKKSMLTVMSSFTSTTTFTISTSLLRRQVVKRQDEGVSDTVDEADYDVAEPSEELPMEIEFEEDNAAENKDKPTLRLNRAKAVIFTPFARLALSLLVER